MLKTLPRGGIFKTIWEAIPKPVSSRFNQVSISYPLKSDRYFVGYDLEGLLSV